VITGAIMIRTEEAELERRFGEEYRSYQRYVPALWPRIYRAPAQPGLPRRPFLGEQKNTLHSVESQGSRSTYQQQG